MDMLEVWTSDLKNMSAFFSKKFYNLKPYIPGEQPQEKSYIKLNTNESAFPPAPLVKEYVKAEQEKLLIYPDPECVELRKMMAETFDVKSDQIIMTNGSGEALNFAFMAFGDEEHPLAFADITYGFYSVFANINHIPYVEIPLKEDFSIDVEDYIGINKTIVIANPNSPTGICLSLEEIEKIVKNNPDNVVIVDEAYIDFGGKSAVRLIDKYDNLLVTGTFSKSRSMAGARLGFAFGNCELIADLNTIRNSTNSYNVNRLTTAAGIATLKESMYYTDKCNIIMQNREWTKNELKKLGFMVIPSQANFLFVKCESIEGRTLYERLKAKGILVRHFDKPRIMDYNRITIGTKEQMQYLISKVGEILGEEI